ncbi:hypothetical protein V5799_028408, partial [Amblyomma americanum]
MLEKARFIRLNRYGTFLAGVTRRRVAGPTGLRAQGVRVALRRQGGHRGGAALGRRRPGATAARGGRAPEPWRAAGLPAPHAAPTSGPLRHARLWCQGRPVGASEPGSVRVRPGCLVWSASFLCERRATASLPESWTPRRRYPGYLAGLSTSRPAVGRQAELRCEPLTLDHCRASLPYNSTAYPNAVGHATARDVYRDLVAYRQLADSECHPLAAELVCRLLQPQCDDAERRVVLPCREFCQEFWSSCQQQMPLAIAGHIDCGCLPEYSAAGSCHTKP